MQEQHERGHGQQSWRWHWALPLCPIAASMFCLSALVYYHTVLQGTGEAWGFFQGIVVGLYRWVGFVPTFMFWLLVFAWCSVWFVTGRFERAWARLGWMAAFAVSLAVLVNLGTDGLAPPPHAGIVGTFLAVRLVSVLGVVFSALLALGAAMASLFLATDFLFYRYFEAMARGRGASEQGVEPEAAEAFRELAFAGIYGDDARTGAAAAPQPRKRIVLEDESVSGFAAAADSAPLDSADLDAAPSPASAPAAAEDHLEARALAAAVDEPGDAVRAEQAGSAIGASDLPETEDFEAVWVASPEEDASSEAVAWSEDDAEADPRAEAEDFVEEADSPGEPIVAIVPQAPGGAPATLHVTPPPPSPEAEAPTYELPRPDAPAVPPRIDHAAREVLAAGRASVILLRRRLGCSPSEAQELLDALRDHGVVDGAHGTPQGGVATTLAQWEAR